MWIKDAQKGRSRRYDAWYPLLRQEMNLVSKPCASTWAIGFTLRKYLRCLGVPEERLVMHYGAQAAASRKKEIDGPVNNVSFERWKKESKVSLFDVRRTAGIVLDQYGVSEPLKSDTLKRIAYLSESSLQLLFHYSRKFKTNRHE